MQLFLEKKKNEKFNNQLTGTKPGTRGSPEQLRPQRRFWPLLLLDIQSLLQKHKGNSLEILQNSK